MIKVGPVDFTIRVAFVVLVVTKQLLVPQRSLVEGQGPVATKSAGR